VWQSFFLFATILKEIVIYKAPQITHRHPQVKLYQIHCKILWEIGLKCRFFTFGGKEMALSILVENNLCLLQTTNREVSHGQSQGIATMLEMVWQPLIHLNSQYPKFLFHQYLHKYKQKPCQNFRLLQNSKAQTKYSTICFKTHIM